MPQRATVDGIVTWEWPGSPPPTLLMHGIGNYGRYWDFFADAIAGRLRLVAPDARGHGESPKPETGYLPADFVGDAIRVLDAKRIQRALVVGHSMGGFHAAALTVMHPDRVLGLVIIDTGPGLEHAAGERARRLSLGRPDGFANEAEALAYLRETSPGYSDAVYANRIAHGFRRDGTALVWHSSKDASRQILETVHSPALRIWERMPDVETPVLLVRGTRSPTFSEARANNTMTLLRHGRLVELDARHNVPLDQPYALADEVARFAADLR